MSNGGGAPNTATGVTGNQPATEQRPNAPGGKGGFPSVQSPYSQQPQVYMPPAQPTFYDQALNSPYSQSQFYRPQQQFYQPAPQYYQQQPQYYQPQYYQPQPQINSFGLGSFSGGMGNAYARQVRYPQVEKTRYTLDQPQSNPVPPPRPVMADETGYLDRTNNFGPVPNQ